MKNSNDTIGNRTRDLPTCSAVPQPTALPCAPTMHSNQANLQWRCNDNDNDDNNNNKSEALSMPGSELSEQNEHVISISNRVAQSPPRK